MPFGCFKRKVKNKIAKDRNYGNDMGISNFIAEAGDYR